MARNLLRQSAPKVLPDDVAAEREGKAGLAEPPFAEVLDEVQAVVGEGELALVDEQPEVDLSVGRPRPRSDRTASATASKSGSNIRSARYALVSGPGIAMRLPLMSARVIGVRATRRGPYRSPIEAPCGSSAYRSER